MMVWVLLFIAIILALVVWEIANFSLRFRKLYHLHMMEMQRQSKKIIDLIERIERHTARAAQPFYTADAADEQRKRADPAAYYWDRDRPFG